MNDSGKPSWIVRVPTPIWLIGFVIVVFVADWLFMIPVLFQYKPAGLALIVVGLAISAWVG